MFCLGGPFADRQATWALVFPTATADGQFGIARYVDDGSPDRTFGSTTGKLHSIVVPEPNRCEAAALAVDSEGGIVVAGHLVED
jgi:hypothetical protein